MMHLTHYRQMIRRRTLTEPIIAISMIEDDIYGEKTIYLFLQSLTTDNKKRQMPQHLSEQIESDKSNRARDKVLR